MPINCDSNGIKLLGVEQAPKLSTKKDSQNGTREVIPLESDRTMKNGYDGRGAVVV